MTRMLTAILALGLCATAAAQPERMVSIQFLGGAKRVTLEGLKVVALRGDSYADRKKVAEGTTDKDGRVTLALGFGYHFIELTSPKELPYLPLPVGYTGKPSWYGRSITVNRNAEQSFTFNLADACKLTLRAVDAETGKGIPGIGFVTENALAEDWGIAVEPDNLGAKPIGANDARQKTDADGNFVRLLGPRRGYTYFPWVGPNYEVVGKFEVEVPTPIGTATADHVFKLRKKAK